LIPSIFDLSPRIWSSERRAHPITTFLFGCGPTFAATVNNLCVFASSAIARADFCVVQLRLGIENLPFADFKWPDADLSSCRDPAMPWNNQWDSQQIFDTLLL